REGEGVEDVPEVQGEDRGRDGDQRGRRSEHAHHEQFDGAREDADRERRCEPPGEPRLHHEQPESHAEREDPQPDAERVYEPLPRLRRRHRGQITEPVYFSPGPAPGASGIAEASRNASCTERSPSRRGRAWESLISGAPAV